MFTEKLALGLQGLGVTATGPTPLIAPATGASSCQDATGNAVDCASGTAIYCSGLGCDPNGAWAGTEIPQSAANLMSDMQAGLNYFSNLLSNTASPTPSTFGGIPTNDWIFIGAGLFVFALFTSGGSGGRRR